MNKMKDFFNEVANGDLDKIKAFIENGIDVNEKDENEQTALMVAVMSNNPEVVKLLLECKADVDAFGIHKEDRNPINYASAYGLVDIVKILLEYKPNMKLLNVYGGTPLIPACEQGHYEVAKLLLEETDVDVNHINNLGYTALYEVTFSPNRSSVYVDITNLLIKHGADRNIKDKGGRTPLEIATKNGLEAIANILEGQ
ncbi:ankyrin repeat domain-containing protein [Paenibacillus sp. CF384]|uniref:ankyrin repeat domain-containing protein n=1 Tax=Paenibacillus sp. CF384 TaxID=1884382 RepID=UPI0008977AF9|nr:ankyrin repeat domain-containing protein [Paenibacillus sp. CF384]SDX06101.1 hypothetical protein SAMN05518855_1008107 [Paenibacillus sp. CF384]